MKCFLNAHFVSGIGLSVQDATANQTGTGGPLSSWPQYLGRGKGVAGKLETRQATVSSVKSIRVKGGENNIRVCGYDSGGR